MISDCQDQQVDFGWAWSSRGTPGRSIPDTVMSDLFIKQHWMKVRDNIIFMGSRCVSTMDDVKDITSSPYYAILKLFGSGRVYSISVEKGACKGKFVRSIVSKWFSTSTWWYVSTYRYWRTGTSTYDCWRLLTDGRCVIGCSDCGDLEHIILGVFITSWDDPTKTAFSL